jgi:hypothetical protein
MTTFTMRYLRGHFIVTGPTLSLSNSSRAEKLRIGVAEHHPGSPIKEMGADAERRAPRAKARKRN